MQISQTITLLLICISYGNKKFDIGSVSKASSVPLAGLPVRSWWSVNSKAVP